MNFNRSMVWILQAQVAFWLVCTQLGYKVTKSDGEPFTESIVHTCFKVNRINLCFRFLMRWARSLKALYFKIHEADSSLSLKNLEKVQLVSFAWTLDTSPRILWRVFATVASVELVTIIHQPLPGNHIYTLLVRPFVKHLAWSSPPSNTS